MRKLMLFGIVGMLSMINFSSCSDDDQSAPGNTFKVRMTDAPGDYVSLEMEIIGVDAYHNGTGWINLSSETHMVNILDLTNGDEMVLANSTNVEAGFYSQIRIRFGTNNTLTLYGQLQGGGIGNIEVALLWTTPKEVVINVNKEITADAGANVLLDFHVAESILENVSDYVIQPTVTVIEDATTGIQGQVEGSLMAAVILTDGEHTYTTYMDASHKFLIRGVEPGTYDMTIIPNQFDPEGPAAEEKHVNNIVIVQGEIKQMGTLQL